MRLHPAACVLALSLAGLPAIPTRAEPPEDPARLFGGRTTFTFSPTLFTVALVQFNSGNRVLSTNVRFRWEYRPGREVFLVYNDGRDTLEPGVRSVRRACSASSGGPSRLPAYIGSCRYSPHPPRALHPRQHRLPPGRLDPRPGA